LPLINQANLTGVLYLENNLSAHVFTPARITILKLLASRAAISLENSRLYRDLEDRERARNRLLAVRALAVMLASTVAPWAPEAPDAPVVEVVSSSPPHAARVIVSRTAVTESRVRMRRESKD
jgi:hypothetical protein